MLACGAYMYLIIKQYLDHQHDYIYYFDELCGYGFPCLYFFSRYAPSMKFEYVIINLLFGLLGLG